MDPDPERAATGGGSRPGRRRAAVGLLAAALALAVAGVSVGIWAVSRGDDGGGAAHAGHGGAAAALDPARFIDLMIPHHEMAVEMAREALPRVRRADTKGLIYDILAVQPWEIDRLRRIRDARYADVPTTRPSAEELAWMGMAHDPDAIARAADPDAAFVEAMMPHHAGAIVMSQRLLRGDPPPDLARLARAIAASQALEIGRMETYRQTWAAERRAADAG